MKKMTKALLAIFTLGMLSVGEASAWYYDGYYYGDGYYEGCHRCHHHYWYY